MCIRDSTHGPIGLYEPLPGNDGHTIFAQGSLERVVLERADIASRQVKPLLNSMPAWEIAYARTGQFAVYNTTFPCVDEKLRLLH